jgi:hypothetical protein
MREIVRSGHALGLFVEGTRSAPASRARAARRGDGRDQRGRPGELRGDLRLVRVAPRELQPVSVAWGDPLTFDGLPRGGKGYKEASVEIEREIRSSGTGSGSSTSSVGRATRRRRHE